MKVLSLFDGISGCQQALKNLGIEFDGVKNQYFASEIDKYAIQITQKNFPNTIQLGDVKDVISTLLPFALFNGGDLEIDLLCGGSSCQDLSIAKKDRKGLEGNKSGLFYEYVKVLQAVKPKYFLLENVSSMCNTDKNVISKTLGVEPILINSSLVTAQQRKRLYWTNIPNVSKPDDRGVLLKDILEIPLRENEYVGNLFNKRIFTEKVGTLGTGSGRTNKQGMCVFKNNWEFIRKLSPLEYERLQGFPDNYTAEISNTQRYKALGNSFTVQVIEHILKAIL